MAVRVVKLPMQIVPEFTVTTGNEFTVTVDVPELIQLLASVPVIV
jgi:hypothetical protein